MDDESPISWHYILTFGDGFAKPHIAIRQRPAIITETFQIRSILKANDILMADLIFEHTSDFMYQRLLADNSGNIISKKEKLITEFKVKYGWNIAILKWQKSSSKSASSIVVFRSHLKIRIVEVVISGRTIGFVFLEIKYLKKDRPSVSDIIFMEWDKYFV